MKAFTLVETLICSAIVAVLAALLLPALIAAQDRARTATCQASMRQLAAATITYAHDWEGWLPAASPTAGISAAAPTAENRAEWLCALFQGAAPLDKCPCGILALSLYLRAVPGGASGEARLFIDRFAPDKPLYEEAQIAAHWPFAMRPGNVVRLDGGAYRWRR